MVEEVFEGGSMVEYQAKVSFHDSQDSFDAVVSVADEHLAIEVSGRPVGRWPIEELSPRIAGDSVLVSAEGEELVIDVTDPEALQVSLRPSDSTDTGVAPADQGTAPPMSVDARLPDEHQEPASIQAGAVQVELRDLQAALAEAQTQLRWVQELVPRRLPIPVREEEAGLGVVQGVRLKERRPLPGSDGLQPWVVVDSGNVYVTSMRLIFSGAQDVDFEYDEIHKKGASRTGLLLGVTSRTQTHILAGPGERLAVVLTAAEKLARGLDPTMPFREAISRLTSEINQDEAGIETASRVPSVD